MSYHETNAADSNKYAFGELKLGGSYGHTFTSIKPTELVWFDGILILGGAKGGTDGAIHRCWDCTDLSYESIVASSMPLTRFLQIKRCLKLCDNTTSPKKGEENYHPAYKFKRGWDVLVHNTNKLSLFFDSDQVIDETTWGHQGYGEAGLMTRIQNKPGITKGGQLVLCMDKNKNYVCFCEVRYQSRPKVESVEGWANFMGPLELKAIIDKMNGLYTQDGTVVTGTHKFKFAPHICGDNFFPSDDVLEYMGKKGIAGKLTRCLCSCKCLSLAENRCPRYCNSLCI
jgi:hypothetical protein